MVKVIMGQKGSGKTKKMIDLINTAVGTEHGNVVAIAHDSKLTFDINYKIRLVDTSDYIIPNYDTLKGFLYGLYAGNYDITDIFVDSVLKIGGSDLEALADFVGKLGHLNTRVVMSVSADKNEIPARVATLAEEI